MPPALDLQPVTLAGRYVVIAPLSQTHHDDLALAVTDGNLHQLWYTSIPAPAAMRAEIDRRLALHAAGLMLPFALLDPASGRALGMTTYMNLDRANRRVEIGSTWVAEHAQRTPLNTEAKLLLLTHAFDTLGCIAVELRTHVLNHQSRRAIERLGAKLDGILRNHQITLRDTAVYSILPSEWSALRTHLQFKLDQPR